ncbi:MAG: hypothetical protein ACFCVK_26235, partial [Acidimicrobiales bacterium]
MTVFGSTVVDPRRIPAGAVIHNGVLYCPDLIHVWPFCPDAGGNGGSDHENPTANQVTITPPAPAPAPAPA